MPSDVRSISIWRRLTNSAVALGLIAAACGQAVAQRPPSPNEEHRSPPASPALRTKVNDLVEEILESELELKVPLRRSRIMRMKQDIFRIAIADPNVVETIAFGAREIEVIGKETGSTTMTLWIGEPGQAQILSLLVTVTRDTEVDERRRLEYGELQIMVNEMFPDSKVQLIPIADKLIVRGQARDEQDVTRIMALIRKSYGGGGSGGGSGGGGGGAVQGIAADPFPEASTLPKASVISMLTVPGVKQVMLKVRIAQISRSAVRSLGTRFNIDVGDFFFASGLAGAGQSILTGTFDEDSFNLILNAASGNGHSKILAEPNLVVLSGQTANFVSGGQFAVPTVVGVGGAQAATTSFQNYGTQLNFTPTVLDHDRIRLQVQPTFSSINSSTAVNGIFGLDTQSVQTTVELREGQVLAIAGLLQDLQSAEDDRIPLFGDIRLLKPLFASRNVARSETELIILVSPELVHPVEPENAPSLLPGMEVTEPDDMDFFIYGNIEGRPDFHHRSTVWPIIKNRLIDCRQKHYESYRPSEDYYIHGEHGFSE